MHPAVHSGAYPRVEPVGAVCRFPTAIWRPNGPLERAIRAYRPEAAAPYDGCMTTTESRQPADLPEGAFDGPLLAELQERFPIDVAPFDVLGERLSVPAEDVLARVIALQASGMLRHITPIFEAAALGYTSSLVAMRIPPDRLDASAAVVGAHPGVTHNYRREHAFNLWFTINVPPGSDLSAHIDRLHELAGSEATLPLPTVRRFKIGVSLDITGSRDMSHKSESGAGRHHKRTGPIEPPSEAEIALIRAVQGNLPLRRDMFHDAAVALGVSDADVVAGLERLRERGALRRVAGILRHREAGFRANGMVVWNVPPERIDEVGRTMASFSAISHCYERPRFDEWPYNMFTMIHARTAEECDAFVAELEAATGVAEHATLYSTIEYKKIRPTYFAPETAEWERANGLR